MFNWDYQWGTFRSGVRTVRQRSSDGPGRASAPPGPLPIASAFGDTDGEFFDRKFFQPKNFVVEPFFGQKLFRPKKISAEKFAVRIAEGGSSGRGEGWREPPGPKNGLRKVLGLAIK